MGIIRMPQFNYFNQTVPLIAYHDKDKLASAATMFDELDVSSKKANQFDEDAALVPFLKP